MYTTIIIGAWFLLCGWRGLRDTPKPGVLPGLWSLVFFGYEVTSEQDHYAH